MDAALLNMCEHFMENRDRIKAAFKWDSSLMYPACANLFCAAGQEADPDRLAQCKQLIKEQTGVFSNFRGNVRPALVCMLSMEEDPEGKLRRVTDNYQLLKQEFWSSAYLVLVSYYLTDLAQHQEAASFVERGKILYRRMKKEHPFLTSQEDSVFAVLMAVSDKSDDDLVEDMETCYRLLKQRFFSGNAVQTVSHVLALSDLQPEEKVERMMALYDGIVQGGGKYGREFELAVLAAMAVQPVAIASAVADMLDADAYLAGQKGYGFWGVGRRARMMHAAMIVSDVCAPRLQVDAAAMTGTLTMIAAQQAASCAVMAGASAAAASASTN